MTTAYEWMEQDTDHKWIDTDELKWTGWDNEVVQKCTVCGLKRWESVYWDCCDVDGDDYSGFTYEYEPAAKHSSYGMWYDEPECARGELSR